MAMAMPEALLVKLGLVNKERQTKGASRAMAMHHGMPCYDMTVYGMYMSGWGYGCVSDAS